MTTKDKDKVIITENGWEIYEEDDDLINKELLTEDISGGLEDLLFTYADTLTIITAHATAQHEGEPNKIRPCLVVLKKKGDNMLRAFQITSVEPYGNKRASNKSPLRDYKRYGLSKLSYINYDHFVDIKKSEISKNLNTELSDYDAKNLYDELTTQYDRLIGHGFKDAEDKKDLDNFIQYLEDKFVKF